MAADVVAILKTYRQMVSQRTPHEPEWRDCAKYIRPLRGSAIGKTPTPGEKQTIGLFDSTAIHACRNLANTMQGTLTSPAVRWFRYRMRTELLNRNADVKAWLEECGNRVYAALGQSNWNAQNLEVFLDLGAFGTSAVFLVERQMGNPATFRGLLFRAIPIGTYVIAEDEESRVDTLIYKFSLTAATVARRFGEKNLPERLVQLAKDKPTEMVELLHAVLPREGGQYGAEATQKPWLACYISERDKHLLEEGGFDSFPFTVPRWEMAGGETYGRGPGHTALPDIKTLNAMTKMELEQIALAIKPPLGARDHGVIGAIRWVPGGVTTIREKDSLVPYESGSKFQVGQIKSSELKMAIKDMFYNNQLQLPTNQPMTATEIERRYELMNRVLGPTVGRIEYEHTTIVPMRAFALMMAKGALPAVPPIIQEAALSGEDDMDVVSEGPLARSQKGSDVLAIERSFQLILPMAQVDPTVLDHINLGAAAVAVMEASQVPASLFATDEEVAQSQQARAQAQQQEQSMQTMERATGAAKNVAPLLAAVKPQTGTAPPAPPAAA